MKDVIVRVLEMLFILGLLWVAGGCQMVKGAGRDLESLGKYMDESIAEPQR